MKNLVKRGKVIEFQNATGALILSGALVIFGGLSGVAVTDIADGDSGSVELEGVYRFPKAAGAIAQGAKVYWATATSNFTTTATSNTLVGYAFSAAASGDATVDVLLANGI